MAGFVHLYHVLIQYIIMRKQHIAVILLFFYYSKVSSVNAQIVNIEKARMQSDSTGWLGNASAALSLTNNVQQVFTTQVDAHMQYKSKKSLYLILGSYGLLKAAGTSLIDNTFLHLRYNYKLSKVLRWEIFTQLQQNIITDIQSRFLIGTGPRFKILSNKVLKLYAASLMMYEQEKETNAAAAVRRGARSSSYISFTLTPNKELEITSTSFFQPLLSNWNDYRILNQVNIRVKAGKKTGMNLNWNYLNDSRPAAGIPSVNYTLGMGFDFEF